MPKKKTSKAQAECVRRYESKFEHKTVNLPIGTTERIKRTGETVGGFINRVVKQELDRLEKQEGQ